MFPQAVERLRQVLFVQPAHPGANVCFGILCGQTGQLPLAAKHLRAGLSSDPNNYEANAWLVSVLRNTGDAVGAEPFALKAVELRPEDPAVHDNLGLTYLAMREPQRALIAFQRLIELAPNIAHGHARLGQTYQALDQFDEACACFRKALEFAPAEEGIRGLLVHVLMTLGRNEEAVEVLQEATRLFPNAASTHLALAQGLFSCELGPQALEPLRRAIRLEPRSALAHGLLGTCLSETGQFAEAVEEFEKALAINPAMGSVYHDLVESKSITNEDAALIERMMFQLKNPKLPPPDRMSIHFACGKACDDLGRYGEAMEQFDRANELCQHVLLGGRPFDRQAYAAVVDEMIQRFPAASVAGGNESDMPIFIVGMIRSGTTLIERILASHPLVAAGGEISYLAGRFDRDHSLGLDTPGGSDRTTKEYLSLLGSLSSSKPRVTDKMPSNFRALGPIHALFPNARIIHCVRNPVDTCLSIYFHLFHNPPEFCCDRENIVFGYREYLRQMAHWRQILPPDRFIEIEYEGLVADKERVTRELITFCDLDWDDRCLQHEKTKGQIRTASRRQARQPVYTSSVHRWKNYEPWLGAFAQLLDLS